MNSFKLVISQTFWQIIGKIITSLSTFLILSLVARTYGKDGLGIYTLVLTYLGMFMLSADFGFNGHLLREIQQNNLKDSKEVFKKLLGTRIIWALFLIIISIALLPLFSFSGEQFVLLTIVGCLSILGSAIFTTTNLIFQKNLRYDLSTWATIIGYIIYVGLIIFVSTNFYPLLSLSLSSMLGWLIIGGSSVILVRKFITDPFPLFDFKFSLNLIKNSWPIAGTLLLNVIYFRADSFLIAFYKNISDVGIYNLSYQFFQAVLVLPAFIMNSYYPILLKNFSHFKAILFGLLGASFFATTVTIVLAPILIFTLAGEGFEGSARSLQILSFGFPAYFLSALLMWTFVTKGMYKLMLKIYTSGLILNLILNLIFIPKYSFLAAAWTTVISEYAILALQGVVLLTSQKRNEN